MAATETNLLDRLGLTSEAFAAKYKAVLGEDIPPAWANLCQKFDLDAPQIIAYLSATNQFEDYGKLHKFYYLTNGHRFGEPKPVVEVPTTPKSPKAEKHDTLTIGDTTIKFLRVPKLETPVCFAAPTELWDVHKPEHAIMFKLFTLRKITVEALAVMIEAFHATPKKVLAEVAWTLDGKYSKFGWTANALPDVRIINITPYNWDGIHFPENTVSYYDYTIWGHTKPRNVDLSHIYEPGQG